MDYDSIKYDLAVDKLEQLNKEILIQEMQKSEYEKQPEIRKYIAVVNHPTVVKYLELLDLHKEVSHKIGLLKKENKNNPNINLLIDKARSIKEQINRLKEEDIIVLYLDLLNNYKVKYYLSHLKELNNTKKQISIQEKRMDELNKKIRKKLLIL